MAMLQGERNISPKCNVLNTLLKKNIQIIIIIIELEIL